MNDFNEIMANATNKVNAKKKVALEHSKSKTEVLNEFIKPLLEFFDYVNSKYTRKEGEPLVNMDNWVPYGNTKKFTRRATLGINRGCWGNLVFEVFVNDSFDCHMKVSEFEANELATVNSFIKAFALDIAKGVERGVIKMK